MRFALGNIDLVEIAYDPLVFFFRISGSNIDRDEGFNMQGKTLDDYPLPQHREAVRGPISGCWSKASPTTRNWSGSTKGDRCAMGG